MTEKPTYGFTDMKHWMDGAECYRRYAGTKDLHKATPSMAYGSWFHFYLTDAMSYRTDGAADRNPHGLPPKLPHKLNESCCMAARYGTEHLCRSPVFADRTHVRYEKQFFRLFQDYTGRASFDAVVWHPDKVYLVDFKTYGGSEPYMNRQEAVKRIMSYDYDLQMAFYQKCYVDTDMPIYWAICWFHRDVTQPIVDIYEPGHMVLENGKEKLARAEYNIATQYSDDVLYRLD